MPPSPLQTRAVLIVDDEPVIRRVLVEVLDEAYRLTAAETGEEAMAAIEAQTFGVAIVDKNLPGDKNGLDVLAELQARSPLTRGIMITAFASKESAVEALRRGAWDYLEKPFDTDLIVEKVRLAWESFTLAYERQEIARKYESLFGVVPGIVWFLTEDGVIRRINDAGAAMLGYAPDELVGKPYEVLIPPDEARPEVHWAFKERRTGPRATRRQSIAMRTKAGERKVFEITSTGTYDRPQHDPHKKSWGTLGVGWDMTEQRTLQDQLQQSRKMEAIGRMAGGIAHDFNNLLAVIINNARFVLADLEQADPRRPDVDEIERAASRGAQLTRQLLAFSSQQVINPKPLDLSAVVDGLRPMLRRLIKEDVELDITAEADLRPIEADPGQIEQVIVNLAANARDAMPHGGRLTIHSANVELDETFASSHLGVAPGHYVMLATSDTGHGMSPEVREHLFEPFYTTKSEVGGTGFGLATVYGIVSQCGGHISVYSELEIGSTIKIYLPAIDAPVEDAPPEATVEPRRGDETILVVEDEEMVRRLTVRILTKHGYAVHQAQNGREALEVADEMATPADVLLVDIVMPEMGGTETAIRLRERWPHLKIIYMSGYVGNVPTTHPMLEDRAQFLAKPFTAPVLLHVLQELLDEPDDA